MAGSTASPQSLNGYAYASNNPVMRSDPSGMNPDDTVTYVTPGGEYTKDFGVYAAAFGGGGGGKKAAGGGGSARLSYYYDYRFPIGLTELVGDPRALIKFVRAHWGVLFPGITSCGQIVQGATCDVQFPAFVGPSGQLFVQFVGEISYSFMGMSGTPGPGSQITFWSSSSDNLTYLHMIAGDAHGDDFLLQMAARILWSNFAANIRQAFRGAD